jgi:hypothetical protein
VVRAICQVILSSFLCSFKTLHDGPETTSVLSGYMLKDKFYRQVIIDLIRFNPLVQHRVSPVSAINPIEINVVRFAGR